MNEKIKKIKNEIKKVIVGKDEVIEKVFISILAGGHILLEDIPGVGKTTLALAFSKTLDMEFNRVQFTPDVIPSDIVGFSMYDKQKKEFVYHKGAILCNFFLADEINRTSSKTQSALLEVMEEGKITVDGQTYKMEQPFVVIATQNPIGTMGTQMLPEAQLDRFMIKISIGYPDFKSQINILKDRERENPIDKITTVVSKEEVIAMKEKVKNIYIDDKIYEYITILTEASRKNEYVKLGLSPRGALALTNMAKATAFVNRRDYVTPEDIEKVLPDVARHRLILNSKSILAEIDADKICTEILEKNRAPKININKG